MCNICIEDLDRFFLFKDQDECLWCRVDLPDFGVQACCHGGFSSWEHQRAQQIRRASQQGRSHHIPFSLALHMRFLYSTASVSDRVIKTAQQTKLNHWHIQVKIYLKKGFMVIMSHAPAYQRAFLVCFCWFFSLEHKIERSFFLLFFSDGLGLSLSASALDCKCKTITKGWNIWVCAILK